MPLEGVYTLHMEEPQPADLSTETMQRPSASPEGQSLEPILVPRADISMVPTSPNLSSVVPATVARHIVETGDTVIIRYNDEPNRPIRVTLSREADRRESGLIHVGQPLAQAVLGCEVDDEIDVEIAGQLRKAVIERIEKTA
jgi:hypothetical protein